MSKFIPLSVPNFEGNERKYVDEAIDAVWVSTGGAFITRLENNMTEYLNVPGVAACQSGTSAIHLSLIDCNIGENDIVIVPTLTFIAAVNPVMYQHATPVFMDCDDSLCIDPVKLRQFLEEECEFKNCDDVNGYDKDIYTAGAICKDRTEKEASELSEKQIGMAGLPGELTKASGLSIRQVDSFNLSKEQAGATRKCIVIHKSTGKQVKAIIVVHVFGNMADMEAIMDIADEYGLTVIEDATEAIGAYYTKGRYTGKYAGTIGDYGAYSFNGNKIITTGGGGAVTASSKESVDHMRYLSTQAKDDPHYYIHDEIGYNYRMTNVQAALGVAQLEELEEFILRKNRNYDLYEKLFDNSNASDAARPHLLKFRENTRSNKWFYALEVNCPVKELISNLEKESIQTRAIWGLIHEQKSYRNCISYKIEEAKYYSEHIINLPCSTSLTEDDIHHVVETMEKYL